MFVAGEMYVGLTTCFLLAARRWLNDPSNDARGCCWFGQRRCDACIGPGKTGVVIAVWLLFGRHVGAAMGCVVVIGRFELSREACLWFVRRGSGDCDVLFAVPFVCAVERRRGLVLGKQRQRPSDAFIFFIFWGAVCLLRGRCMSG